MKPTFKTIRPFVFLVLALLASFEVSAAPTRFKKFIGFPDSTTGLGFNLGEPSFIRYTQFTGWKKAWSYGVGYSFDKLVTGTVDHLWYFYSADDKIKDDNFWNSILFFGGVGVRGAVGLPGVDPNDTWQAGVRAVGGLEYIFINSPWSFRVDLAPTLYFKGARNFTVSATVGFTYYWFDGAGKSGGSSMGAPSDFDDVQPPVQPARPVQPRPAMQTRPAVTPKPGQASTKPNATKPTAPQQQPKPDTSEFD